MTDLPDDDSLFHELRRVSDLVDPMPPGLVDQVLFAIALADLEVEVCRLVEEPRQLAGVRSVDEATTRATFESRSLTIMVEWSPSGDGVMRLDGWLVPPEPRRIEIGTVDGPLTVSTDEGGRFAAGRVPCGPVQITVLHTTDPQGTDGRTVVTPSFVL